MTRRKSSPQTADLFEHNDGLLEGSLDLKVAERILDEGQRDEPNFQASNSGGLGCWDRSNPALRDIIGNFRLQTQRTAA